MTNLSIGVKSYFFMICIFFNNFFISIRNIKDMKHKIRHFMTEFVFIY